MIKEDTMRLDQSHLGKARILTDKTVVAGSVITMTLEYTVGKYGLDDSGNIRIAWRSVSDWEGPQFDDPKAFGYTTVSTDGNAVLHYKKGVHQRPFHNCLDIKVRDGDLYEGDKIYVTFGDTSKGSPGFRVQTFAESNHEYRVFADPLNTCRFEMLDEIPTMSVVAGPINEVQVVVPSHTVEGDNFDTVVRVLDEWGNPCRAFNGVVELKGKEGLIIPEVVDFSKTNEGFVRLKDCKISNKGVYHIEGLYPDHNIVGLSNGIVCDEKKQFNLYWGDAHGQTSLTIGTGSLDEYFSFAKGPAAIDFTGWQGNDFEITPEKWEMVKEKTKAYHTPGEFVTLLGYEWSGNHPGGGDHNVYYLGDDEEFYPHCNWSSWDEQNNDNNRYPLNELHDEFRGRKDVLVIPHIGGRPGNLDYYDADHTPVIEIHSHHGTFEWFARDAMERKLKVGFIATSDDHTCRPGLSYPLQNVKQMAAAFDVTSGFTAVYAKDLTREGLFEAIKKRRVYATTFARILLGVSIGDHYMGEEIYLDKNPKLDIDVVGTGPIKSVEIIKGTETIYKETYKNEKAVGSNKRLVKIMWEGVATRGRRKSTNWDGTVHISEGKICSAETIAFDRIEQGITGMTNQWFSFHSTTSGDMDGLLIEVDAPDTAKLSFNSSVLNYEVEVGELNVEPKLYTGGGVNLNSSVCLIDNEQLSTYNKDTFNAKISFTDNLTEGMNPYWVKVVQEDGHMAWSSPIFVNKK